MSNPYLELDKKIVSEIYTSTEPMDNLKVLCDVHGSRFPGTPGDLGSVKYMVEKLKEYGIKDAYYEPFKIPGWKRGPAKLSITSPIKRDFDCISLPHSITGEVEAKLVWLAEGAVEVYEKRKEEIKDNIVMVSSANPPGAARSLHRTEKFMRSILAGAKGWIFMNQYPAYGPQTGGISPIVPSIGICYEDGMFLTRILERAGEVEVRIKTTDKNMNVTTYNVIGDVPGTLNSKEYVVVGSHYDGHDISQGAVDPASGAVVVLEIARVLSLIKKDLKRKVRGMCFGAEETGLFGSYAYTSMHSDDLENIRFMLNLDAGGGAGRKGVTLHDHPELEEFMKKAAQELKSPFPFGHRVGPYSDHWPFYLRGVPCGSGGDIEAARTTQGRGYGHSRYDTVDKVELENLWKAASNYSRFLLRVANSDKWVARRKTQNEIDEFIKKQGYNETVQLADKVKEYVKTWDEIHPDTIEWINRKGDW
ncbi:M28 family peptidase [Candidatus Bathyarchaeota archaeon]|nr:M28 family peptidase [Candidatus Bathyarchaeota archaeon]